MNTIQAAILHANACYTAGALSSREFVILVQDYASQLQTIGNDNDEESRKERLRLVNELYEKSTQLLKVMG